MQKELIDFTLSLGNNIVLQENETYPSLYREPRIGREDNRIVGIQKLQSGIKLHLPKNRTFRIYFQSLNLWNQAYHKNNRGYTFLRIIDSEQKVSTAKDLIKHAYRSIL